jgi:hypothetical protein
MVYYNEPENASDGISGSTFTAEFKHEVGVIRAAANDAPNVFTAMAAEAYGYQNGGDGTNCSYVPPPQYTDFYFIDAYQPTPTGGNLANESPTQWNNWLSCVSGYNKPIGLAEYGLGTCGVNGNTTRENSMAADDPYLESLFGSSTINAPVIMLSYWYADDSSKGACRNWEFTDAPTIKEWQRIETGP